MESARGFENSSTSRCLFGWLFLVLVVFAKVSAITIKGTAPPSTRQQEEGPEPDVVQIIRARGFIAEVHKLTTADGYILSLVRMLNPLVNNGRNGGMTGNRRTILFVSSETASGAEYVSGSEGIEPKDLSRLDIHDQQVRRSLAGEPSSRALPFLSSNFGHDVWILQRRTTPGSLNHTMYEAYTNGNTLIGSTTGRPVSQRCTSDDPETGNYDANKELLPILEQYARESIDSRYWNFSLDNQALIDLPEALNYVLSRTGQEKLALVAWSSGASMTLMMLSELPEYNLMVSDAILLAPTFIRSPTADIATNSVRAALSKYTGPFTLKPPRHLTRQVVCLLLRACYANNGKTECDSINQGSPPPGRIGNRATTQEELMQIAGFPISAKELVQFKQNLGRPLHFYDYGDPLKNLEAYGRTKPPAYDVSKITLETISIWSGPFDRVAGEKEINSLVASFRVPIELHYFNNSELYFDHNSVVFHSEVNTLINLPALAKIEPQNGSKTSNILH